MVWRKDKDLMFLSELKNDDLELLFSILTVDPKDGKARYTEELTKSQAYKTFGTDYSKYWRVIAGELQTYGSNSIATMLRGGKGVLYKEILTDVCKTTKVKFEEKDSIEKMEQELLYKFLEKTLEQMSEKEKREFLDDLNIKTDIKFLTSQNVAHALRFAMKTGGITTYKLALIVANTLSKVLLGRALRFPGMSKVIGTIAFLTGPAGAAIMGAWTIVDIASAASRVTVPATVIVATLRIINEENQKIALNQ